MRTLDRGPYSYRNKKVPAKDMNIVAYYNEKVCLSYALNAQFNSLTKTYARKIDMGRDKQKNPQSYIHQENKKHKISIYLFLANIIIDRRRLQTVEQNRIVDRKKKTISNEKLLHNFCISCTHRRQFVLFFFFFRLALIASR